jgi:hypothetical protein
MEQHFGRSLASVACGGALALAIAGCGSTGPSSAAASGGPQPAKDRASFLKFSQCMRSHGVTNFPDPSPGGGLQINSSSGIDPRSQSFQTAQQACKKLLPGGGPGNRTISATDRQKLLANAQCMRTHGVPNFPDPLISGGRIAINLGQGVNPNSPAFQGAVKACGGIFGGPGGKGGGKGGGFALRITAGG